jgi:hypothetical protein
MIALTVDHGIAPIPAESAKLGVASTRLDLDDFTMAIDESLNARFSPDKSVQYCSCSQEARRSSLAPKYSPHARGYSAVSGEPRWRGSVDLFQPFTDLSCSGKVPNTEFGRLIVHSYSDHGGWYFQRRTRWSIRPAYKPPIFLLGAMTDMFHWVSLEKIFARTISRVSCPSGYRCNVRIHFGSQCAFGQCWSGTHRGAAAR